MDRQTASMENEIMFNNPEVELHINLYDDDSIHFKHHNLRRKQADYQKLKFTDPKRYMVIDMRYTAHLQEHQDMMAEEEKRSMKRVAELEKQKEGLNV
jgi:hypothetical protein